MSEAIVGELLGAVAGASAIGGAMLAVRPRSSARSRPAIPIRSAHLWLVVPAVIAAIVPGPRLLTVPLAALAGTRARRLVAARREARHRSTMDREVPQLLDLLAAGSAAGLSAFAAMRRAVDGLRGPLAVELRRTLDAVDLGARWYPELGGTADRLALPDLRRAVAVIGRTQALGSSLTEATRDLAADARSSRRAAIAERARAAPVKMLFPLVFLILPAFLLLTVVPVLLTTVRSIR
jgi:tight adherence protein C